MTRAASVLAVVLVGTLAGCGSADSAASATSTEDAAAACAPDNGGISLPDGFCAAVLADGIGAARHLVVREDGTVFVALRNTRDQAGGVVALRDTTGDARVDLTVRFGDNGGTGIALAGESLYFATDDAVLRYPLPARASEPSGPPDTIVAGLPADRSHRAKAIALSADGATLYVNHGSPSNSCQEQDRESRSPGMDPCPELETRGGVWAFDARRPGQTLADGERFVTGTRNMVALTTGPDGRLYGVQHGRDQLAQNWGFTEQEGAEKPAEEMFAMDRGDDFGWPYCYYDAQLGRKVLAPEYGGDGQEAGRCADKEDPIVAFPGHWAPNAVAFYRGDAFPERYRGGAFVAFHGSWNRAPLPQEGYNVVFVPFEGGAPGAWEVFADGFAGAQKDPGGAEHRPSGLAVGPDGALDIADDAGGRIWRVVPDGAGTP